MSLSLKSYFSALGADEREEFARRCSSTVGVIKNVMYGFRPCATDLAVAIWRESGYKVLRWDLRPHDWHRHWPELIEAEGAPPVPASESEKAGA